MKLRVFSEVKLVESEERHVVDSQGFFKGDKSGNEEKYTLEHLQMLYVELIKLQHLGNNVDRSQVVEVLRAISELIVYGDQHSEHIFEYFCEKNMLAVFTSMLNGRSGAEVKRQIIQTVSILVQNVSNDTYLYYLLSNNHINELIRHPFDFQDEDILALYVSFVKMLSLKLNSNTVQFFFNEATGSFPLFTEAVKLIDHDEGMVRAHIRNLLLLVYRVDDEGIRRFVQRPIHRPIFTKLSWSLRNQCSHLSRMLSNGKVSTSDQTKTVPH